MSFFPPAYCGMPLERSSMYRGNPAWVEAQLSSNDARVLPVWRNRNLFNVGVEQSPPTACYIQQRHAEIIVRDSREVVYLGHDSHAPVFAADITHLEKQQALELVTMVAVGVKFIDLRSVGPVLPEEQASIMAYARGLTYWHRQNQYCGRCGSATVSRRGGHMRQCSDPLCKRGIFPRIDPAVIMLVDQLEPEDGIARCLLGRHKGLPQRVYSTLAGYVDPGESLEEAVAREVMEEAGIAIREITYLASQPWPFPASMMVGFRARTRGRQISIAEDELEDARWFTAEQLRNFGEYDDGSSGFALPRKDSIARTLIESWLSECEARN